MSHSTLNFIRTIFDPDERICTTNTPYGTEIKYNPNDQYFCINPLIGPRKDANVTVYRNILLEFDKVDRRQQWEISTTIPYTTMVWSGGKSYHFIISLNSPLESKQEYDAIVARIYAKVPDADPANKNPSRLSRLGGATRDNGEKQQIVHIGERISRQLLEDWLGPAPEAPKPKRRQPGMRKLMSQKTIYFLAYGVQEGYWNATLFSSACDLVRCGYDADEIADLISSINGYITKADKRTIESAFKAVAEQVP